jgi:dihydroorotase
VSGVLLRNAVPVGLDRTASARRDLRLEAGRIAAIGENLPARDGDEIVDLEGAHVAPAFFDPHVHFRTPGQEYKETLESGARAAVAGGFADVAMMPNTEPPLDEAYRVRGVRARAESLGLARLHVIAACTVGLAGDALTEMSALAEAGAIAVSDDGRPVESASRMRRVLEWARPLGLVVVTHAEDLALRGDGVMNEGPAATRLGLPGIPAAAEGAAIARDLELAALTGAHLHVAHVSTARGVELVRDAKRRGLRVTAETAPHYLLCTDEDVARLGTAAKMNPPLRSAEDREAVLHGVVDGTIDCLATDHAPHHPDEKARSFAEAPFGVVGLETALAAALTALHHGARMPLADVIERLTAGPRRAFGLPQPALAAGDAADLVAFDPNVEWTVDPEAFHSLGRHTPFAGRTLRGRVLGTWIGGRCVFRRARAESGAGASKGEVAAAVAAASSVESTQPVAAAAGGDR